MKNKKMLKKALSIFAVILMIFAMAVPAFATSSTESVDVVVSAVQSGLDEVTGTITVGNVVTIILAAIGASILLVFFWWALRKVIRAVMSAFRSGKLKI